MDAQTLHTKATQNAQAAVDALLAKHGPDHGAFAYCGFAWVVIKPARGKLVNHLKSLRVGNRGVYGGYQFFPQIDFPANHPVWQSMDLREAAARAYADTLQAEGVNCSMQSRAD